MRSWWGARKECWRRQNTLPTPGACRSRALKSQLKPARGPQSAHAPPPRPCPSHRSQSGELEGWTQPRPTASSSPRMQQPLRGRERPPTQAQQRPQQACCHPTRAWPTHRDQFQNYPWQSASLEKTRRRHFVISSAHWGPSNEQTLLLSPGCSPVVPCLVTSSGELPHAGSAGAMPLGHSMAGSTSV